MEIVRLPHYGLLIALLLAKINCDENERIPDKLDDNYGQCLVPKICRLRCLGDTPLRVNCSDVQAGPYVPEFTYYVITVRTDWEFDFSHNFIKNLDEGSFYTDNEVAVNLKSLNLSFNLIEDIHPKTFTGNVSVNLKVLDLSYNRITALEKSVFDDTPALQKLILSNNLLTSLDGICGASIPSLKLLDLSRNSISYVQEDCFKRLGGTAEILLHHNSIFTVNDCAYSGISVTKDTFESNPIICGCTTVANLACKRLQGNTVSDSVEQSCPQRPCRVLTLAAQLHQAGVWKGKLAITWNVPEPSTKFTVTVLELGKDGYDKVTMVAVLTADVNVNNFSTVINNTDRNYSACVTPKDSFPQCVLVKALIKEEEKSEAAVSLRTGATVGIVLAVLAVIAIIVVVVVVVVLRYRQHPAHEDIEENEQSNDRADLM